MSGTEPAATTQVYRVYIKAAPEQVWDAITKPEWTDRYGYGGLTDYNLTPGAPYRTRPSQAMVDGAEAGGFTVPDTVIDGEVVEADPPHKLVLTWRMLMDPRLVAEGFTRLTYELVEKNGSTRLTVTHELAGAPQLAALVSGSFDDEEMGGGGGWAWVLSDLKSLLETGKTLAE
ncbi:SRPBCC domain-containing protein [Kitasatospora sp. NPDC051914]|uniref:SRPBCC domain-containing protein n=1 Tax=Kitasatospora sp. NPDC051914 TaxID=3154945 RepID=UPI00343DF8AA